MTRPAETGWAGPVPGTPSAYEQWAWAEIQRYKAERGGEAGAPPQSVVPLPAPGARVATRVAEAVLPALSTAMNDAAQWRVADLPRRQLAAVGVPLGDPGAVGSLDLEVLDRAASGIRGRYAPAMALQGGTAGVFGVAGMAVDVPVLVLSNLRAVGEYGTTYGFDLSLLHERVWASQVLALSAGANSGARAAALWNLRQIAAAIGQGASWAELDQIAMVAILRRLARTLGVELTTRRLSRLVPVLGAAVGGVANLRLTAQTCEAAYHLYRERFLIRKYGAAAWGLAPAPIADEAALVHRLAHGPRALEAGGG